MNQQQPNQNVRKPYQRPAIVYSAPLEAQAGSPLGGNPLQSFFERSEVDPK